MEDPQARLAHMIQALKEKKQRLTPQRLAILKLLAEDVHPTIEEIYEAIKAGFPTTSLATIYKTVNLLKEKREVMELHFTGWGKRYDGNRPYPHPHAICVHCGRIREPEAPPLTELTQQVSDHTGYRITHHQLNFYGICPACQGKA